MLNASKVFKVLLGVIRRILIAVCWLTTEIFGDKGPRKIGNPTGDDFRLLRPTSLIIAEVERGSPE